MNTALVCIAKNEDPYIDEWIDYHLKLGFSKIVIYCNNWNYKNTYSDLTKIECIDWPNQDINTQTSAYNNFIKNNYNKYNWVAFFDVDEFLFIHENTLEEFLQKYFKHHAIKIHWRRFGDNNLKCVIDNNYSVIDRFTKSAKNLDTTTKSIINLDISGNKYTTNGHNVFPVNAIDVNDSAEIFHYQTKTYQEYKYRKLGFEIIYTNQLNVFNSNPNAFDKWYKQHNFNDIDNFQLRDKYNVLKNNYKNLVKES